MARCGLNLQTSRVLFSFLKRKNCFFGTENGKEKHKSILGGLRMEDQGVESSQTFLERKFSFLQPPRKHGHQCTFNRVLNTHRGFKAASRTLENKNGNVQYYFKA